MHWRQEYEVANRHGARQITGENGSPGAVFHSLRSITNTLGICADIERFCPDAFLINLTNPMIRVTLAVNQATNVRNVGMCDEMPMGINRLCRRLRVKRADVEAGASGINHFTFFTEPTPPASASPTMCSGRPCTSHQTPRRTPPAQRYKSMAASVERHTRMRTLSGELTPAD